MIELYGAVPHSVVIALVALAAMGGVVVGMWAHARIPDGVDATAWRRLARRLRKMRRWRLT